MILAAIGDTAYDVVLILHLASVVVAFAPAVVHPIMSAQYKRAETEEQATFALFVAQNSRRVYAPALVVVGALGIVLILLSDDVWAFDQVWISLSFLVWIVLNGLLHGLMIPAERRLAEGDLAMEGRISVVGGVMTLLFVVMLYLMVVKPGL